MAPRPSPTRKVSAARSISGSVSPRTDPHSTPANPGRPEAGSRVVDPARRPSAIISGVVIESPSRKIARGVRTRTQRTPAAPSPHPEFREVPRARSATRKPTARQPATSSRTTRMPSHKRQGSQRGGHNPPPQPDVANEIIELPADGRKGLNITELKEMSIQKLTQV